MQKQSSMTIHVSNYQLYTFAATFLTAGWEVRARQSLLEYRSSFLILLFDPHSVAFNSNSLACTLESPVTIKSNIQLSILLVLLARKYKFMYLQSWEYHGAIYGMWAHQWPPRRTTDPLAGDRRRSQSCMGRQGWRRPPPTEKLAGGSQCGPVRPVSERPCPPTHSMGTPYISKELLITKAHKYMYLMEAPCHMDFITSELRVTTSLD